MHRHWPQEEENRQQQRGTKRTRTIPEKNVRSQSSENSDQNNEEDDVDVPLSKRINRLNIEYSSDQSSSNLENFSDKYPYEPGSAYYRPNELLHSLHEERRQRNQQASLHKALTSHLKL